MQYKDVHSELISLNLGTIESYREFYFSLLREEKYKDMSHEFVGRSR